MQYVEKKQKISSSKCNNKIFYIKLKWDERFPLKDKECWTGKAGFKWPSYVLHAKII